MPKLPSFKPREVEAILLQNGFIRNVSKSSHRQYFNPQTGAHATVPFHTKDVAPGTLRSIVHQSQLPIEQFRK